MSESNSLHNSIELAGATKFAPFTVTDITYKTVRNTPIQASILVPRSILDKPVGGKRPLTVRWHGGFLVTGHRLFADWYPQFILDLCIKHNAVAITVDYRLMPEANGIQILEDVKDFYAWLTPENLELYLPEGVDVDTDHLLVTGESAGGYIAFQSALAAPAVTKAVIMHYPMLDLRDPHYTKAYIKHMFDPPIPQIPTRVMDDHLAKLTGDEVVTSAVPMDRVVFAGSMIQQGRTTEFLGNERSLYPLELLDDGAVSDAGLPPMWILHGKQDSAVPAQGTHRFAEKLRETAPSTQTHITIEDGEHGFDNHALITGAAASLDTVWVAEGVQFIEKYWPVQM